MGAALGALFIEGPWRLPSRLFIRVVERELGWLSLPWVPNASGPLLRCNMHKGASTTRWPNLIFTVACFVLRSGFDFVKYTSAHTRQSFWLSSARGNAGPIHGIQRSRILRCAVDGRHWLAVGNQF